MSKIKTIQVSNLKAIAEFSADFGGHTAIITGSNNKGKSSFLTSIPDRIRGVRPDMVLREGTESGKAFMELTTGERFEWEFTESKDKLTFYTKDGIKASMTKELSARYFRPIFDIDKFLNSSPKEQSKQLQALVGIDFKAIDLEYKQAYDRRTGANSAYKNAAARLSAMPEIEAVQPVDVSGLTAKKEEIRKALNDQYKANKEANDNLREEYDIAKTKQSIKYHAELAEKNRLESNIAVATRLYTELAAIGYSGSEVTEFIKSMPRIEKVEDVIIPEPTYIEERPNDAELVEIDKQIASASEVNSNFEKFKARQLAVEELKEAQKQAELFDAQVKEVEQRKKDMILNSQMPEGIELTEEGITVDGFPLQSNQISTSKLYISALKIASLNMGEVQTLYFDASPLDKASLIMIQEWAEAKGFQLLIERPSWEDQELQYELIHEKA
jgi:hypothetical protein